MKQYLYILLFALLLIGCRDTYEPQQHMSLPVYLSLPTNEMVNMQQAPIRKVIGDPGTTETFFFPNYVYFILLKKVDNEWVIWRTLERTLTDDDWKATHYSGRLNTTGDSIYQYKEEIVMPMSKPKFDGRIYAIASAEPLTFSQSISSITNLSQTLNLKFSTASSTIQHNLQHVYSTPYNYNVGGSYYGSFSGIRSTVPHVQLMLYHVASKVDIKWNVTADKRINKEDPSAAVRLTNMQARYLFNGNAYCFMPMRNTVPTLPTAGYSINDIITPADEGLWWEGRTYFYTIPYTVESETRYFPLQMLMRTNGTSGSGYQLTLKQPIDTTSVFVPWIRGNFVFNKPLDDKTETKTVE